MIWLILGLILILLLFIFFLIRVAVTIQLSFCSSESVFRVSIYLYKLRLFKREIPFTEPEQEEVASYLLDSDDQSIPTLSSFGKFKEAKDKVLSLLNQSRMTQLDWDTTVGLPDSSHTAILYGGVWIVKSGVIGMLDSRGVLRCEPNLLVKPCFNTLYFETEAYCMISIRIGQAIYHIVRR